MANANEDNVSVLAVPDGEVVETINLAWQPNGLASASPNALAFSDDGRTLYVCNGVQNTLAVIRFRPGKSEVTGLVPTGWYPGALAVLPKSGRIVVANVKGLGSGAADQLAGKGSSNSHHHTGTVSIIPVPDRDALTAHTRTAMENTKRAVLDAALLPPRPDAPPRPVPERAGEPSTIRHVVYIIKENRTYDQVLGDLPQGRGDPFLCVFGENITPNQHKICREFVLLDNTHCCGVLSADGHQWSTAGYVTDYLEKSFAGFPRSYPDLCGIEDHDALSYSPSGFLWDAALKKNLWVRNFGESSNVNSARWTDPASKGKPGYIDCVNDWKDGMTRITYRTTSGMESLEPHSCTNFVGWLTGVPDVVRAELFIRELKEWTAKGDMPALSVMVLPQDHTVGTGQGNPTPAACVADNDLAVGRVVEALSHSPFWKDLAVFIIEDDPQAGWDHVSPYRTTAYVVSPWCRRGAVVGEMYSQTSLLRTMELILGLPPMNLLDAIATPMTTCFADHPDPTPFTAVPNNIPVEQLNGQASLIPDPVLKQDALASARLPLDKVDACPEDVFNRILWRAMKGSAAPYPEWATVPEGLRGDDDDDD
ncbi:MAG: alkaline phosphatase family protein [Kiritimatiellia bacterium]